MHFQICGNNNGNIIHVFKICISISVATVWKCLKMPVPICTSHWCLVPAMLRWFFNILIWVHYNINLLEAIRIVSRLCWWYTALIYIYIYIYKIYKTTQINFFEHPLVHTVKVYCGNCFNWIYRSVLCWFVCFGPWDFNMLYIFAGIHWSNSEWSDKATTLTL